VARRAQTGVSAGATIGTPRPVSSSSWKAGSACGTGLDTGAARSTLHLKATPTKLSTALFATAGLFAAQALATTTDWGVHDTLEVAAAVTSIGSFEDSYRFKLPGKLSLFSTAVSNNLTQVLGLGSGNVALLREDGAADLAVGSFAFDETTGSISHPFGALDSGDYYYLVSGIGTGAAGGFYALSSTITAVPEASAYALMLAGLGATLFVVRRRRQ